MSIFDHNAECIDKKFEVKIREMQKTYLEGALELKREELEADFNNLFKEFNEQFKNGGPDNGELYDMLDYCRISLSEFFEIRSELIVTNRELECAKDELNESEE